MISKAVRCSSPGRPRSMTSISRDSGARAVRSGAGRGGPGRAAACAQGAPTQAVPDARRRPRRPPAARAAEGASGKGSWAWAVQARPSPATDAAPPAARPLPSPKPPKTSASSASARRPVKGPSGRDLASSRTGRRQRDRNRRPENTPVLAAPADGDLFGHPQGVRGNRDPQTPRRSKTVSS